MLQSKGMRSKQRRAEPFSEEELLCSTGQLGYHSPQVLVDTMLIMYSIYIFSL